MSGNGNNSRSKLNPTATGSRRPNSASGPHTTARSATGSATTAPSRPASAASSYAAPTAASRGAIRPAATAPTRANNTANANASSTTSSTLAGLKRKTRAGSTDAEKEPVVTKRPALSNAFNAHINQSSLNRQLLAAQAQVTELQNSNLEKQAKIDRLEADLRLLDSREQEEREARRRGEEELQAQNNKYEAQLASLRKRLLDLEAAHENLNESYSSLSHSTQCHITDLEAKLTKRDQQVSLLESQRDDAEKISSELEDHIKEMEKFIENLTTGIEDGEEEEDEMEQRNRNLLGELARAKEEADAEVGTESIVIPEAAVQGDMNVSERLDETSVESKSPIEVRDDEESDADADGEDQLDSDADGETDNGAEEMPIDVDKVAEKKSESASSEEGSDSVTSPTPERELRSQSPLRRTLSREDEQDQHAALGEPQSYEFSSPVSSPSRSVRRSLSSSVASSAMSIVQEDTPSKTLQYHSPHTSTPPVKDSASPDPLARMRGRLHRCSTTPGVRRSRPSFPASLSASFMFPGLSPSISGVSTRTLAEEKKDREVVRAELSRQTSHVKSLEAANARLTSELTRLRVKAEGAEVLREEKRELTRRLESMEALRRKIAELEEVVQTYSKKEKEWEAKIQSTTTSAENAPPSETPVGVIHQFSTLRRTHMMLLDEHGLLKADLRSRAVELSETQAELEGSQNQLTQLRTEIDSLYDSLTRKEKDHTLLEREVAFLKSLIASYQTEEEEHKARPVEDSEHLVSREKLEERILQLEALLEEYKTTNVELEKKLDEVSKYTQSLNPKQHQQPSRLAERERIAQLEHAIEEFRTERARQVERIESLEQEIFDLGGEIGAGRHVAPGIRVVCLRENPAQLWADTRQAVLERLKAENAALLKRLKEVEESAAATGAVQPLVAAGGKVTELNGLMVPRASFEAVLEEKEELSSTVEQKEKRLLRLQQVFTAKSAEFKDAIEAILGLKFTFYPNGSVRIRSVYNPSASFVFQPSKDKDVRARMQLIGGDEGGLEEMEGLMNTWIREEMSIPCFMASVTLECYDKRKREQGVMDIS